MIIDPGGAKTIAAGTAVIENATMGIKIYMISNLPYSEVLELGHSKQAPSGVVRITAEEFAGIAADVINSLNQ